MADIFVLEPGEWNETLVVTPVEKEEAAELASAATTWLLEQGVVEGAPWFSLQGPIGHAAGPNAGTAHDEAASQGKYGHVAIYASGEGIIVMGKTGPIMMRCPRCGVRQGFKEDVFSAWETQADAAPQCNTCRHAESLDRWDGGSDFACARLTITFNHWPPLKESFKRSLMQVINRQIRTVTCKPLKGV